MSGGLASAIWWDCTLVISADADWLDYVRKNREDSTWFHHNHVPLVVSSIPSFFNHHHKGLGWCVAFKLNHLRRKWEKWEEWERSFFLGGELFSLFCFCFCLCCFCRDSPPHLKRLHLQLKPWKKHDSRNNKAIIPKIFTHPMGTDVLRVGIFQLRFFLLFWQHLRELLYPQMGFLDRLVVPQDPEKKNKCIYGLASFLNKSDKLIVLWSPKYFSRLWCTCLS